MAIQVGCNYVTLASAYFMLLCICYYTFWSGVADLSARLPEGACARGGRADKPQHHDKRCNKMFITGC